VEECVRQGVAVLTLFAFSSENWRRPRSEVDVLMELFISALRGEVKRLNENGVRLRIIGERGAFPERLQRGIVDAEKATSGNDVMVLQVAANYGGRWDIVQASRQLAQAAIAGDLDPSRLNEDDFCRYLSFSDLPDPDLFIRTGGEQRLSNFLLWQSAYAELYFSDLMWPDFGSEALASAISEFGRRQRRFGLTGEQVGAGPARDSA
jgi:undecaprenyl diphosphate synthase